MCGIVGYIGPKPVVPVIMEGLARLEYRGYDSAGIAVAGGATPDGSPIGLQLRRAPGKLRNLEAVLAANPVHGTFGIGHTRWATHGRPTEENAHPHRDGTGTLVVVHNGIVENYLQLKAALIAKGHTFVSETDTEIIAHVIQDELELAKLDPAAQAASAATTPGAPSSPTASPSTKVGSTDAPQGGPSLEANESEAAIVLASSSLPLEEAVRRAVLRLTGAFAIGVLSANEPDKLVAARFGPPAVLGLGDGEYFLASDVPGILHHTRTIYFLADGELAVLTPRGITLSDFNGQPKTLIPQRVTWDPIQAEKAGYKHFMLKEINEQPRAIRDTTLGRVSLDTGRVFLPDLGLSPELIRAATQITIAACGTSWHAGLAGKFMIERLARLPVDVDYASEYRYRDPHPQHRRYRPPHHPVRRNRRHPRRPERAHRQRLQNARHLQRRRRRRHPPRRRNNHDERGPGDRRRLHQGLHRPAHRPLPPRPSPRPDPQHHLRGRIPPLRHRARPHPRQARTNALPPHPQRHRRSRRHSRPHSGVFTRHHTGCPTPRL